MRAIFLSGLALGVTSLPLPATAGEPGVRMGQPHMSVQRTAPAGHVQVNRWGHRIGGRWHGGWFAPGGWTAWRRPVVGFALPRYWIQPAFYIPNYWVYGLDAPAYGYGWSRYYDDAVLTDRHGRVHGHKSGVHWDMDDSTVYRQAAPPRLESYDYGTYPDHGVTWRGDRDGDDAQYRGTWTGTWTGEDGRTYSGTYTGAYRGDVEERYGYADDHPQYVLPYHQGYYAGGYYYPATTTTTIIVHPSVTTTTTTFIEEEVVYAAPKRTWKPKTKTRTYNK